MNPVTILACSPTDWAIATKAAAKYSQCPMGSTVKNLANLGGGGLGLAVGVEDAGVIGRHANWWIQFELPPSVITPIRATARVAHRHLRSDRSLYCGLCFDFSQNPSHRQVVARQIMRAIAGLQRRQMTVRRAG